MSPLLSNLTGPITVSTGLRAERDASDRGGDTGGAGHDCQHRRVRGDTNRAGGERRQPAGYGDQKARIFHALSHRRLSAVA